MALIPLVPRCFAPALEGRAFASIFGPDRLAHIVANSNPDAFRFLLDANYVVLLPHKNSTFRHFRTSFDLQSDSQMDHSAPSRRRALAAMTSTIAIGSQVSTISRMNQRMACSLSSPKSIAA